MKFSGYNNTDIIILDWLEPHDILINIVLVCKQWNTFYKRSNYNMTKITDTHLYSLYVQNCKNDGELFEILKNNSQLKVLRLPEVTHFKYFNQLHHLQYLSIRNMRDYVPNILLHTLHITYDKTWIISHWFNSEQNYNFHTLYVDGNLFLFDKINININVLHITTKERSLFIEWLPNNCKKLYVNILSLSNDQGNISFDINVPIMIEELYINAKYIYKLAPIIVPNLRVLKVRTSLLSKFKKIFPFVSVLEF